MAKFKVGDRVRYTGSVYSSLNGKVGEVTKIDIQMSIWYHVVYPQGGPPWALEESEIELYSTNPAPMPVPPAPTHKFNVGDRVMVNGMSPTIDGKTFRIKGLLQLAGFGNSYDVFGHGVSFDVPEGNCTLVQSIQIGDFSPTTVTAGGARECKSVTPSIEPVCPSCGCKDARNYVGFMSIECVNQCCAHYKPVKELARHG